MKGLSPSRAMRRAQTGIEVPRWEARTLINSPGRVSHGHFDRWNRSRQERFCAEWRERCRQARTAAVAPAARQAERSGGRVAPVHDRHRSVLRGHDWARPFQARGHTVRLMAPRLVTRCRVGGKRGRNGAADAAAICEAMQRPDMRLEPIKSEAQHSRLTVHRARQGFVSSERPPSIASVGCSASSASRCR